MGTLIDTRATLVQMVRDALETMTPLERVVFLDDVSRDYCLECGDHEEPGKVCTCLKENG